MIDRMIKYLGLDGFVLALGGAILLAYVLPTPGMWPGIGDCGALSLHQLSNYGVSLIFFFYGLKLSPEELKSGLSNWRLHLVIHLVTFVVFPLVVLLVNSLAGASWDSLLWVGVFFLATLPSTVSSSVVMISIARGNIPAAIFNASISSLIGVLVTPLWMGLVLSSGGGSALDAIGEFDFAGVIGKLSLQVLLPVLVGILLHSKFGPVALKHSRKLKLFDQSVILLIVYLSFCKSFVNNMFKGFSLWEIFFLGVAMLFLFFVIYGITTLLSNLLNFSKEDRITAVFCGSKKSLIHGTVMAKVLFAGFSGMGLILLPLMMFHALQLVVASIIAKHFSRRES